MEEEDFGLMLEDYNLEDIKVEEIGLNFKYEKVVKSENGLDEKSNAKINNSYIIITEEVFQGKAEIKVEPEEIKLEVEFLQHEIDEPSKLDFPFQAIPELTLQKPKRNQPQNVKVVKRIRKSKVKKGKLFKCKICEISYKGKDGLNFHINSVHENLKPFKCDICSRYFNRKFCLSSHIIKVHKINLKPYKCGICSKFFDSNRYLTHHLNKTKCSQGGSSSNKDNIDPALVTNGNVELHKCEECNYSSNIKNNVLSHTLSVHRKFKPFKCAECDSSFNRKDRLALHIRAIHQKEKSFKCVECSNSFFRKDRLASHIRSVHRKLKPFKCHDCGHSYSSKQHLTLHIQENHDELNAKKCRKCDFLGVKFELAKHFQEVHEKKKDLNVVNVSHDLLIKATYQDTLKGFMLIENN